MAQKRKLTDAQIVGVVKPLEAGRTAAEMAREIGVSTYTIYNWKAKFGGLEPNEATKLRHMEDDNGRLKKLVAELALDKEMLKALLTKKRTELVDRRANAAYLIETFAAAQRKACELAQITRSSFRYRSDSENDQKLTEKLRHLAAEKPRNGYRRLCVLLGRQGERVNHKRVFRGYRAAGLTVKRRKRKRLVRAGQPAFVATKPNQQWLLDFVHDRLANGRTVRVLTVVDTFTLECLALDVVRIGNSGGNRVQVKTTRHSETLCCEVGNRSMSELLRCACAARTFLVHSLNPQFEETPSEPPEI